MVPQAMSLPRQCRDLATMSAVTHAEITQDACGLKGSNRRLQMAGSTEAVAREVLAFFLCT